MPELDGWEVCRVLRESSKRKTIPIIMLSALADDAARAKGLGLGADDYLGKPFSVRELLLKVRKLLDRRRELCLALNTQQDQETSLRYLVHEVRNALAVIGGYSSLALQKNGHDRYFKTINASAMHADSLLNDAALLSRLERKGGALPIERLDLDLLAHDVIGIFELNASRNNIDIAIVNRASATVFGNSTAVRQVLINLISNAVKFNRDNGKVRLSFEKTPDRLDVSITDEGRGISETDLPKVFDKYYRASGSETVKGAGLGLYIVKILMQAMGGTIRAVSSRASGSTFTFSLPLSQTAGSAGIITGAATALSAAPGTEG